MSFVTSSLFVLGFFGVGHFVARWAMPTVLWRYRLWLASFIGLACNQLFVYLGLPVRATAWLYCITGIGYAAFLFWFWIHRKEKLASYFTGLGPRLLPIYLLSLLPIGKIIFENVYTWDGRFHWFFPGKILFFDQHFISSSWQRPEIVFCHPAYPKLIAILSSQFASLVGAWKGHWPKFCLLILYLVATWGALSLPVRNRTAVLFSALILAESGWYLWNGMFDGYLGIFACLGLLYFGLWLQQGKEEFFLLAVFCTGLIFVLKNEGMILGGLMIAVVLAGKLRLSLRLSRKVLLVSVLAFLPAVAWAVLRLSWGLGNDLEGSYVLKNDFWRRTELSFLSQRVFSEGYLGLFMSFYFLKTDLRFALPICFVSALWVLSFAREKIEWRGFIYCLCVFLAYSLVLFFYYLLVTGYTPREQLNASIHRIAIPCTYLVIGMLFFVIRRVVDRSRAN